MTAKQATAVIVGIALAVASASAAQTAARVAKKTTRYFAFYSDVATNLNDALIAAGLARRDKKAELFHAGEEAACFAKQPPSVRAAWDGAVDYYARVISPAEWNARQQYLLRVHLAGFQDEIKDAGARQFVNIAESFRAAAMPAYEACRWPAQHAENSRWIEDVTARLEKHEQKIATRLAQLYQKKWAPPIPVDVVNTVNWAGANSLISPPHLLVSTAHERSHAMEIVFHEASHGFMDRTDPIRQALDTAARAAQFRLPGDLWHVVLFYTTGEVVRRVLNEAGEPGYIPAVYGIFDRGTWVEYRAPLEQVWRAYVNGEQPLAETATSFIEAIRSRR